MFTLRNLYKTTATLLIPLVFLLSLGIPLSAQAQNFQITGMQDMNGGTFSGGTGNVDVIDGTICIYRSSGGKNYFVTATGGGSGGAFTATSGSNTLAYQVGWDNAASSTTFTTLTAGTATRFNNADKDFANCNGGWNASLRIRFLNANLAAAAPGTYNDTVTIVIGP